jgi:uncharacterized protein YdaL
MKPQTRNSAIKRFKSLYGTIPTEKELAQFMKNYDTSCGTMSPKEMKEFTKRYKDVKFENTY